MTTLTSTPTTPVSTATTPTAGPAAPAGPVGRRPGRLPVGVVVAAGVATALGLLLAQPEEAETSRPQGTAQSALPSGSTHQDHLAQAPASAAGLPSGSTHQDHLVQAPR